MQRLSRSKPWRAGLVHRGAGQRRADPPSLVLGQDGELLEVGVPVDEEDVDEAHRGTLLVDGGHEQEAGLARPLPSVRGRAQEDRLDGVAEVLLELRPTGVLDRRDVRQVRRPGGPDPMSTTVGGESDRP